MMDKETAQGIFETYSRFVFSTALFLTGSRSLADDITQDSFLRIFHSYESYDSRKPLKPWIYKIVLNTARTALKQQSRRKTLLLDFDIESDEDEVSNHLVKQEYKRELLGALGQISLKSREILVLRFFEDMSLIEISQTLSIPVGTCKSRLNTAIRQLRRHLSPEVARQYEGGERVEGT